MPVSNIRRGAAKGKAGFPNANSIRVDATNDVLVFGTGASGTTEKTAVDTSSTQTLTGKTLTTPTVTAPILSASAQTLAAAGSIQGDAGAITATRPGNVVVTGADGTKGVILPASVAGATYYLKNNAAAILKVYPAGTDTINAIAASTAISMASLTSAVFICIAAGAWFTIPLLPS